MEVEWIRCDERLPDESDFYWVQLPIVFEDEAMPEPQMAEWYADMTAWGLLGLSDLVFTDDEIFPTYWACAELPEPPKEAADDSAK